MSILDPELCIEPHLSLKIQFVSLLVDAKVPFRRGCHNYEPLLLDSNLRTAATKRGIGDELN